MGHPTSSRKPVPAGSGGLPSILAGRRRYRGEEPRSRAVPAWNQVIGLILGLLLGVPAAGARPEQVLRSDETGVRFTVEVPPATWTAHDLRGGAFVSQEPHISGFPNGGLPGRPQLPQRGGWVVVPAGMRPVLAVVAEEWQPLAPRPLLLAPTPVIYPDPETGEPVLGQELLRPGENPHRGEVVPEALAAAAGAAKAAAGAAVRLGEVVGWRGRRLVSYAISPLQVDAAGNAVRQLARGTWEIRFVPDAEAKTGSGAPVLGKLNRKGDDRFGFLFLNGKMLDRWLPDAAQTGELAVARDKAAALPPALRPQKGTLLAPEVRIPVTRTRLYRVEASGLRQAGLLPSTPIREDQIRLYQRRYSEERAAAGLDPAYVEIEVPIRMIGEGDNFEGDDFFLFWGLRPRDDGPYESDLGQGPVTIPGCGDPQENYNDANIYFLAASEPDAGESWARMDVASLAAAQEPPLAGYRRVEYFEENQAYHEIADSVQFDRNRFNSSYASSADVRLRLYSADPNGVDDRLRVGLYGATTTSTGNRPVEIYLENGTDSTLLGTANPWTYEQSIYQTTLSGSQLTDRDVTIHIQRPGGVANLAAFLDWVELSYDALYRARDDTLLFHGGDATGDRDIEVTGFRTADLGLVEVTDPHQPVWIALAPQNLLDAGGSTTLSLRVPQPAGRRTFFADSEMTGGGIPPILYFKAEQVPQGDDPLVVSGDPDLLVVTHPSFRGSALNRWMSHRVARSGGALNVHLVDVQSLYDHFSGGLKDPWAIKRFCHAAIARWGSWALQLVGDANENARGLGDAESGSSPYYCEPTDWVPTRLHVQQVSNLPPEFLTSDKWFCTTAAGPHWPEDTGSPSDMYVGRFPCNSQSDLERMVDKVIACENVQAGQAWRKKAVFWADDAWSYDTLDQVGATMTYNPGEEIFEDSEDQMAGWWDELSDVGLVPVRFFMSDLLDHAVPIDTLPNGTLSRNSRLTIDTCEEVVLPVLLGTLNSGALLVSYQGHANMKLLAHEQVFYDANNNRRDVSLLQNQGKPWIFVGLGCHISDWAQNTVKGLSVVEQSLGEKLLLRGDLSGASAVYASPGYEYLSENATFGQVLLDRIVHQPPVESVDGRNVRSRWLLGELLWAAEGDLLVPGGWDQVHREMVAQYELLGDPLMVLDCGPPVVTAYLADAQGDTLSGERELEALDATNVRAIEFAAADEAGIDRLVVHGPDSYDYAAHVTETLPPGATSQQRTTYRLELPVRPFDHDVTVQIYDTAQPAGAAAGFQLVLHLRQTAAFYLAGEPVVAGQVPFQTGVPLDLTAAVHTAAWLDENWPLQLTGDNLELTNVQVDRVDEHTLNLNFTATAPTNADVDRSVVLNINGLPSTYVLGQASPVPGRLQAVYAFPNPMSDQTRFLFRTDVPSSAGGRIRIFSVSGRPVATLRVRPENFQGNDAVVPWDGRDGQGDRLANGVYLYRVELNSPAGELRSGMQRLVMMR